ncbi:amino acid transporter AVT1I-like [Cynara cardunculus var. scolymus]|uniref:Amino acid transporter, transmembrane n=1 Tax=Cynara cardunculus var. scolymus TaxID=59895 RepID=A0A103XSM8_CYNCS|nr:amino acid transporter AVT1I-like [Cynara cardunculus var. scolymus]KVH96152.1 Amino acid transporter, transmembrane [Cynara cardunculus var. scolymus]
MDTNNVERMESQNQHPQSHDPPPTKGTTFLRTCFNGVNTLSGVGILSVPYALSEGGWLSLLLLLLVAVLCFYTGLLLRRCMDSDPVIRTYPDIGQVAFGRKGRMVISTFMYLELFLVAVEFLIMEGDNLHKLFPKESFDVLGMKISGKQGFVLMTAFVVLPTTWLRSLGALAYVSAGGVMASVILVLAVLWGGAFDGIGFHGKGELWNWNGLPTAISLFTFCYCGHAVFPTLCHSMKDKSQFSKVLLVCFILSTISYGSMAMLGYLMFGENIMSQVTLNLPTKNISSKIAIYTTLINPVTKYALVVAPIATSVEETFPFQESRVMSCLIRTCLVISTVFVALMVPFFGYVMAFIGAFLSITVSILFPCLCYLKIVVGFKRFGGELMVILVIILIGTFVAVVGTYTALSAILKEVQHK